MAGVFPNLKKDDSFEVLPAEDDELTSSGSNKLFATDTYSFISSNSWNFSETESNDIGNYFISSTESDVLKSCSDLAVDRTLSSVQKMETFKGDSFIQVFSDSYALEDLECQPEYLEITSNFSNIKNVESCSSNNDIVLIENPYEDITHSSLRVLELVPSDSKVKKKMESCTEQSLHLDVPFNVSDDIKNIVSASTILDDRLQIIHKTIRNLEENEISLAVCEKISKRPAVTVYRGRSKSSKRICEAVNNGLKLYKWLERYPIVQTVLESAKFSFNSFAKLFELDFSQMISINDEKNLDLAIVSEESHFSAIEEAFRSIFDDQMSFTRLAPVQSSIPTLPSGLMAGVQAAEMKIHSARQNARHSTLISTSAVLYEAIPERWQLATVICLDDPKLRLQLHNFTASFPIPNEYVIEVKKMTPTLYIEENPGFATGVDQAISNLTSVTVEDAQKFLTGLHSHVTLKSAVMVLAGMYKKYL